MIQAVTQLLHFGKQDDATLYDMFLLESALLVSKFCISKLVVPFQVVVLYKSVKFCSSETVSLLSQGMSKAA